MFYNAIMTDRTKNDVACHPGVVLQVYDPENLPTEKLCICDIIRELPELTDEDVAQYRDE